MQKSFHIIKIHPLKLSGCILYMLLLKTPYFIFILVSFSKNGFDKTNKNTTFETEYAIIKAKLEPT